MKEILLESGFPIFFPEKVMEESERLPELIPAAEIATTQRHARCAYVYH